MKLELAGWLMFAIPLFVFGCADETRTTVSRVRELPPADKTAVTISDQGTHYRVVLNFENGTSHAQMGAEYARKIRLAVPRFEELLDSYLNELVQGRDDVYSRYLDRVAAIKPQIDPDYRDEITGMALQFSGGAVSARDDGKLSRDELYLLNLIPDVARPTACSAVAAYGSRSRNRRTIVARTLDWPDGSRSQLAKIQAVVLIRNHDKSVCFVGYLGFLGAITGINDDRVFAALLDAPTGAAYSAAARRSYPFDLRYALEHKSTLDGVADFMKDPARRYAFNHLVFLADLNTAAVLENAVRGTGPAARRALRTAASELNEQVPWDLPDAIAAVNAFMLRGNDDNFSPRPDNVARWQSIREQLAATGGTVTIDQLREIAASHGGQAPGSAAGDLYNAMTQQIILYQPAEMGLDVFFRPRTGELPSVPRFEAIPIPFNK